VNGPQHENVPSTSRAGLFLEVTMPSIINSTGTSSGLATTADASGVLELQCAGNIGISIDATRNATIGGGLIATNATDGFIYIPTCAGTPTGAPTAKTGFSSVVVDATNGKLYFYSGGAWRDAGL
jgi:hypothetical protein